MDDYYNGCKKFQCFEKMLNHRYYTSRNLRHIWSLNQYKMSLAIQFIHNEKQRYHTLRSIIEIQFYHER